ncbi:MAG: nucleotide excision repair endonuclease [Proteobacteria bacterium]|nr:MAG: nucleotide excision repair endonuclease [Pseudomonadota bacterium]
MPGNSRQESLEFDQKLGPDFIHLVPQESGIYLFKNAAGEILYVGKAKNLRRRLSQYRLAPKKKSFRKMRLIVKRSSSLEYQICANEREALLLENQMILEHKPPLNVAGAYSFLYPYFGLKREGPRILSLGYTTSPESLAAHGFELYGAFRSRACVSDAYDALAFLLTFFGHVCLPERKAYGDVRFSRIVCFRQIPAEWETLLLELFRGESPKIIQTLVLELLEKPKARQLSAEVHMHVQNLSAFFKLESQKLRAVMKAHGMNANMIPQSSRDRLFLSRD